MALSSLTSFGSSRASVRRSVSAARQLGIVGRHSVGDFLRVVGRDVVAHDGAWIVVHLAFSMVFRLANRIIGFEKIGC